MGLEVEHVDGLETCIKDVDALAAHITAAVKAFEEGSSGQIGAGIDELGQFFSRVGTTMEDCEKVGADDVAKLKNVGDAFLQPKKLLIDTIQGVHLNGVQINNNIKAAEYKLTAGAYEAAGEL